MKRSAPSAQRNRGPIAAVLADWLPSTGLVLEVASGSGQHAIYFAERFPNLDWQPTDSDPDALSSIEAWRADSGLSNLREPVILDAASATWPIAAADAMLNINMVHISTWDAALGLIEGAGRVLHAGAPLILYGPWIQQRFLTAASNIAFDEDLRRRNPAWGVRNVEEFAAEAEKRGLIYEDQRPMPANNIMLRFIRR